VARRAAAEQRQPAATGPVYRQEAARGHVLASEHRAGRRGNVALARQRAQNPIANIGEIGRSGAKIVVLGRLVIRNLAGDRFGPGGRGVSALRDPGEGRRRQDIVLSRISAASPSTLSTSAQTAAMAASIAAPRSARSRAGSPVGTRRATARSSRTTGPAASPGAAA